MTCRADRSQCPQCPPMHGGLYSYYSWLLPGCGPPDSSGPIPPSRRPARQSRRLAETRAHWSRLGWNEYEGTSPWCCHGATHRVLALLSPALLYIMHFFSSRWRWYRCSEMCYSRNLVHGEKNISRSHPHQFISGKFPFPVTSPRSRTPPKNRLQKRFVWIIMCLVWRNNGDWCLHLSSYFSCLEPRALQRCTSNQAIREGSRGGHQALISNVCFEYIHIPVKVTEVFVMWLHVTFAGG